MKRLLLLSFIISAMSVYAQDAIKPILIDNTTGWEWIYADKHISHNDSYPIKLSYSSFASHPQYKVVFVDDTYIDDREHNYMVYTNNGDLVRAGMPINHIAGNEYIVSQEIVNKLQNHIYIKDFRDDKYGFSKEDTKAKNYVQKKLGLPPFNASRPKVYAGYSEIGNRYLEQLKEDHKNDFIIPLKCERLNDMSFKITFGNDNLEPTHTYMITYTGKGTFNYDFSIADMAVEYVDKSELLAQTEKEKSEKVFDVVEEMPQFPGGFSALFEYLANSIQYPEVAKANGIQGRVVCSFIVEKNGAISEVKVFKGVDPALDKEAQRVILSMPRWIPGKQNGAAVKVKYTVPVTFRL